MKSYLSLSLVTFSLALAAPLSAQPVAGPEARGGPPRRQKNWGHAKEAPRGGRVARGAVAYALARRGLAPKIAAGAARNYYLRVETAPPGTPRGGGSPG